MIANPGKKQILTGVTYTGPTVDSTGLYSIDNNSRFADDMLYTENGDIDLAELAELIPILKERLLLLVPDFEKMEEYPALKEAYDHYKMLEKLCYKNKEDK